jgi:hypothetical protein
MQLPHPAIRDLKTEMQLRHMFGFTACIVPHFARQGKALACFADKAMKDMHASSAMS